MVNLTIYTNYIYAIKDYSCIDYREAFENIHIYMIDNKKVKRPKSECKRECTL